NLESLPVSRPDSVSSSSKKLLSQSKSMASYPKKKSCGNGSSVSSFSSFSGNLTGNSCPLDSSVGIKRDTSVYSRFEKNSRGEFGDFSDSGRIGYGSSKRMNPKFLTPTTQTLKLRPKENSRTSSTSLTSIDSASPSSYLDQREGMNKSKSRFLRSWFDKLPLAQAMGCLQGKSSSKSKKTKESCVEEFSWEEEFKKAKKRVEEESKQMKIMLDTRQKNAKDHYVLEQVAKINCSGFIDDSALPSNLETRFRRLKSLPVSRSDSVSSSSKKKLLTQSKTMASYPEKKNHGNVSSVSSFSNQVGKSCPLDSSVEEQIFTRTKCNQSVSSRGGLGESSGSRRIVSSSSRFSCGNVSSVSKLSDFSGKSCPLDSYVEETQIFSGIKHNPRVNSRGGLGDFSERIGSSSSRFSREGKISTATQTLKLLPKEKSRISSPSSTSIDVASLSSDQNLKERSNRKSKSNSKFLTSWFNKLSPAQAMGCLRHTPNKSSPNNKKEVYWEEDLKKEAKASFKETEEVLRKANGAVKRLRRLRSESKFD
ncbi:hypothetical protein ISN45_Aa01g015830, partial [Arabidopsis thaliana x Arabidopsis arenosa]